MPAATMAEECGRGENALSEWQEDGKCKVQIVNCKLAIDLGMDYRSKGSQRSQGLAGRKANRAGPS